MKWMLTWLVLALGLALAIAQAAHACDDDLGDTQEFSAPVMLAYGGYGGGQALAAPQFAPSYGACDVGVQQAPVFRAPSSCGAGQALAPRFYAAPRALAAPRFYAAPAAAPRFYSAPRASFAPSRGVFLAPADVAGLPGINAGGKVKFKNSFNSGINRSRVRSR